MSNFSGGIGRDLEAEERSQDERTSMHVLTIDRLTSNIRWGFSLDGVQFEKYNAPHDTDDWAGLRYHIMHELVLQFATITVEEAGWLWDHRKWEDESNG